MFYLFMLDMSRLLHFSQPQRPGVKSNISNIFFIVHYKKTICSLNAEMASEISESSSDLFSNYQYKELVINEQKYLIGVCKKDNGIWHVILTNLYDFLEETLDENLILERCKVLANYFTHKIVKI